MSVLLIKAGVREQVAACGGQQVCAIIPGMPAGKRHQAFSDYGNRCRRSGFRLVPPSPIFLSGFLLRFWRTLPSGLPDS